jgi:Autoinducer synthase
MLRLIEKSCASFYPKEMDAMFRNRALTFSDRLGWDVTVKDGYEQDVFDQADPLYLVSVDPINDRYWGSLRLLPTTGPNMLRDVFPFLSRQWRDDRERDDLGELADLRDGGRGATGAHQNRRQLCLERAHCRHRGGRGDGGSYPDRFGLRRPHFSSPQGGRLQSSPDRQTAADWRHDGLCRLVRDRRGPFGRLPRGPRDRQLGPGAGNARLGFLLRKQSGVNAADRLCIVHVFPSTDLPVVTEFARQR